MLQETTQFEAWLTNPNFAIAVTAFLLITISSWVWFMAIWIRGTLIKHLERVENKVIELVNATIESNAVNKTGIDLLVELYKNGTKKNGN